MSASAGAGSAQRDALVRAMPWVFVLIWSTGFVVARLAMPHSPPFAFLVVRFALSAVCFAIWIALVRAAWPAGRTQWAQLLVTGAFMQAGYLGGSAGEELPDVVADRLREAGE